MLVYYGLVLLAAWLCRVAGRALRIPATLLTLLVGLLAGRTGLVLVAGSKLGLLLPGALVHVGALLAGLGARHGSSWLRKPLLRLLRECLLPLAAAGLFLFSGLILMEKTLPRTQPGAPQVLVPLSVFLAALPLLAVRDLRGTPRDGDGSHFLVAVTLIGALFSFAPVALWAPHTVPAAFWRNPILVLGESGALGAGLVVLGLFLTRRLRAPKLPVGIVLALVLLGACLRLKLWIPFATYGAGIALGRAAATLSFARFPSRALHDETPFVLIAGLSFAPDLFRDVLAPGSFLYSCGLASVVLWIRQRSPHGRELVTGPGLLFLGLTLTLRLDPELSPLPRYVIDFALPAWALTRFLLWCAQTRERRGVQRTPRPEGGG